MVESKYKASWSRCSKRLLTFGLCGGLDLGHAVAVVDTVVVFGAEFLRTDAMLVATAPGALVAVIAGALGLVEAIAALGAGIDAAIVVANAKRPVTNR